MKSSIGFLVAGFLGWLVAQTVKVALRYVKAGPRVKGRYFSSGEMPSAHTATVVAFMTAVFAIQGLSDLFAIAAMLTAITVYDALVARRSIGEQGLALVQILEQLKVKGVLPRVALGHKPLEVVVGGMVGLLVGYTVALFITI